MLFEIHRELAAELRRKGVPFPVYYGPDLTRNMPANVSRIVVERDRFSGDASGPPRRGMPNMVSVRAVGCVVRIFAQATLPGSAVHEHERLVDAMLDQVEVALRVIIAKRRTLWRVTSQKLLSGAELEARDLRTWPGVVYEYRFQIDRGVTDHNWKGEGPPTVELGPGGVPLDSTTRVSLAAGAEDSTAETACGGN